jgi:hypothetical protein
MGTLSRVVDRFVHEVGLPRADSVRIARKLNRFAKSVDWATPVEDDLDKLGRKRKRVSRKVTVRASKRANGGKKPSQPRRTPKKQRASN